MKKTNIKQNRGKKIEEGDDNYLFCNTSTNLVQNFPLFNKRTSESFTEP